MDNTNGINNFSVISIIEELNQIACSDITSCCCVTFQKKLEPNEVQARKALLAKNLANLKGLIEQIEDTTQINNEYDAFKKCVSTMHSFLERHVESKACAQIKTTIRQVNTLFKKYISHSSMSLQEKEQLFNNHIEHLARILYTANLSEIPEKITKWLSINHCWLTDKRLLEHLPQKLILKLTSHLIKANSFSNIQNYLDELPSIAQQFRTLISDSQLPLNAQSLASMKNNGFLIEQVLSCLIDIHYIPVDQWESNGIPSEYFENMSHHVNWVAFQEIRSQDPFVKKVLMACSQATRGYTRIFCNVNTDMQTFGLVLDEEQIQKTPLRLLFQIDECLKLNPSFPKIYLVKEGILISDRGAKAIFLTKLLSVLFKNTFNSNSVVTNPLNPISAHEIEPSIIQKVCDDPQEIKTEKTRRALNIVGKLLNECAIDHINIKSVVATKFFEILQLEKCAQFQSLYFNKEEDPSLVDIENQFIRAWLILKNKDPRIVDLFSPSKQCRYTEQEQTQLRYAMLQMYALHKKQNESDIYILSSEGIRTSFLSEAKQDGELLAVSLITQGMAVSAGLSLNRVVATKTDFEKSDSSLQID